MKTNIKDIIIINLAFVISYIIIPLTILNYFDNTEIYKLGFFIILIVSFLAFALNIIYTYIRNGHILIPCSSIVVAISLIFTFNKSAIILIIIIAILSFLGYYLGKIFTKSK